MSGETSPVQTNNRRSRECKYGETCRQPKYCFENKLLKLDIMAPFYKEHVVIKICRDLKTIAGCRFFHPRPSNFPPEKQQQQQFFQDHRQQQQQQQQQQAPRAFQGRQEVPKIDHFDPGMVENLQVDVPEAKTFRQKVIQVENFQVDTFKVENFQEASETDHKGRI